MQVTRRWSVDVDRGPDWLFAALRCEDRTDEEAPDLAESLWEVLQCHFSHRMVVELEHLPCLSSFLLGQLVLLSKRIHNAGGLLRLSGVSQDGQKSIAAAGLDRLFPYYKDREDAVRGQHPRQPR